MIRTLGMLWTSYRVLWISQQHVEYGACGCNFILVMCAGKDCNRAAGSSRLQQHFLLKPDIGDMEERANPP